MDDQRVAPVYTPASFLDAEHRRIAGTWFWQAFVKHVEMQARQHADLTFAAAGGDEKNLRVAAAMASAFKTVLALPDLIRQGKVVLPGQIIGPAPARTGPRPDPMEEDTDDATDQDR